MSDPYRELPVPPHYDSERVDQVWRVPYEQRASAAGAWAKTHGISPSSSDRLRVGLLLIDVQNTFCVPDFELFVGGRSGSGAVDDNRRLCEFIYRNLASITEINPTLDTHTAAQIFHAIFFVDEEGEHPPPYTTITSEDIETGRWRFNEEVDTRLPERAMHVYLRHYTSSLEREGRFALTVWPYHAMLGGVGHALVSSIEEAVFFHAISRATRPRFSIKGDDPLTESYSALGPEVLTDDSGAPLGPLSDELLERLVVYDTLIIAGQAKSHCVSWTVTDLLTRIAQPGSNAPERIYLLEDCTSPVVVPGVIDYTDDADRAFAAFDQWGTHVVRSTTPMAQWPEMASDSLPE